MAVPVSALTPHGKGPRRETTRGRSEQVGGSYDYFKWVKGKEEVDMGWTSAGTFLVTRHPNDISRGGFAAHILSPVPAGRIGDSVDRFLRASRKKLGEIFVYARGAAVFTHWSMQLQTAQRKERKALEKFFALAEIPADIQWAENDTLTKCVFDAETGICSTETMPYGKETDLKSECIANNSSSSNPKIFPPVPRSMNIGKQLAFQRVFGIPNGMDLQAAQSEAGFRVTFGH